MVGEPVQLASSWAWSGIEQSMETVVRYAMSASRARKSDDPPERSTGRNAISVAPPTYGQASIHHGIKPGARPSVPIQRRSKPALEAEAKPFGTPDGDSASRQLAVLTTARPSLDGMPGHVRGKMEQAFGADIANVRIHRDSREAERIGAAAFTRGNELHFAPRRFEPRSGAGQELLGHELAHVAQQSSEATVPRSQVGRMYVNDSPRLEAEASRAGRIAATGGRVPGSHSMTAGVASADAPIQLYPSEIVKKIMALLGVPVTLALQIYDSLSAGASWALGLFGRLLGGGDDQELDELNVRMARADSILLPADDDMDLFDAGEYESRLLVKKLGLQEEELDRAGRGGSYREFNSGGGHKDGGGKYKSGFTSTLGTAILLDTFKDANVTEFYPSDVFLSHLKKAAEWAAEGEMVEEVSLPQFPHQIFIPQIMNVETHDAIMKSLTDNEVKHTAQTRGLLLEPGSNDYENVSDAPLLKLMRRIVRGYNLLSGPQRKLKIVNVWVYYNLEQSSAGRFASLRIDFE